MKVAKKRKLEPLKSRSILSHKAFRRNPLPRKATQAKNNEIMACVSPKINPTAIGNKVSKPAICSKNPRFANKRLLISVAE